MYRKCATERSAAHQKQVEEALLALMLKMPYDQITVTELCQRAGIPRRIFYHLFSSKQGALYALIDHRILALEGCHPECSDEETRFFTYWKEQAPLFDALADSDLMALLLERMITIVLDERSDMRSWLEKNGWSLQKEVLIYQLCGIMGLTCSWHRDGYRKSTQEMAALVRQIMTQPMTLPYGQ